MNKKNPLCHIMIGCIILLGFSALPAGDEEQIRTVRQMIDQGSHFDRDALKAAIQKKIAGSQLEEKELISLGFSYFRSRKAQIGLELLKIVSELFPHSAPAWSSLGDGYWTIDDLPRALLCMEKGAGLDPDNAEIRSNIILLKAELFDKQHQTDTLATPLPHQPSGLKGPYLGQKDPGTEPQIFADGLVSSANSNEFACCFSADGSAFYFSRRLSGKQNQIMISRLSEQGWTVPGEAGINPGYANNEPHITHDGETLYFGTVRPIPPGTPASHFHTWTCKRTKEGWSDPSYFGPGMFVSSSQFGRIYTTDINGFAGGGLVVYEPQQGGGYSKPRPAVDWAESWPGRMAHGCIDWQERFLIFNSEREDGMGGSDLYISFRQTDGSWGKAIHMGPQINSPGHDFAASLSPDGKFMFYSRHQDIYWLNLKQFLASLTEKG